MCVGNKTIAIIDSGIGGVSILKQLIVKFNAGNFIYYADNLYMPYGNKSKPFLIKRLDYIINLMFNYYKVDYVIIACNTASTIVGALNYQNVITMKFKNLTYFATELTKQNLVNNIVIASRTLARQIENNIFNKNKLDRIIKQNVTKFKLNRHKSIVLGCTHYELVKNFFIKYCPNTKIINNSSYILEDIPKIKNTELNLKIILSKQDKKLEDKIHRLINF